MQTNHYNVLILGGGITGSALLYTLSNYTNIGSIALIEKYNQLAQVNTKSTSNSQTLHYGDIETNYTLEKAQIVREGAEMLAHYVDRIGTSTGLYTKYHKMVLGVGAQEVENLTQRFELFKTSFPKLQLLDAKAIAAAEPLVMQGRDPSEPVTAIFSPDGYTVDFGKLAEHFVADAQAAAREKAQVFLDTKVLQIVRTNGMYEVTTTKNTYTADVVIAALGAHSLGFAQQLGYGKEYIILPVLGNFYRSKRKLLNGKVYTVQKEKLPFAAVHGDPDVKNSAETRFGPTAKVLPILERRNLRTFFDFLRLFGIDRDSIASMLTILSDQDILGFVVHNMLYDLPFFGKKIFAATVRKIIPSIKSSDIYFGKGLGGLRPQLVNKKERKLLLGVSEITGYNIIFNITPSPGATSCLKAAQITTEKIISFFGSRFTFNKEKFKLDH